jgi:hypothetical protein
MLSLVHTKEEKKKAQAFLEREFKKNLKREGRLNIGFPGGNADEIVYSAGKGKLWAAFGPPAQDSGIPRFWNAFGVFDPDDTSQTITVEINIAVESNSKQVAAFFAEDTETGEIYLLHSGKIGGGRPGVGKTSFLVWSRETLTDATERGEQLRSGIVIGKLGAPDLIDRIWKFVQTVHSFKEAAVAGLLNSSGFQRQVQEFERYNREFSGKKRGVFGGAFEYITYHGDVVQKLYEERDERRGPDEEIYNSTLIDLFVKRSGSLSEVYEVKTGCDRQSLYTAIGQLMTHANGPIAKFLVIPSSEDVPTDLGKAIADLAITIRRFELTRSGKKREVRLL